MQVPETRYAKNGDVNIAYQISGAGPIDLVYTGDWSNHLDLDWEEPRWVEIFARLGSFARLIRLNRRGQGLSDRRVPPTAIEEEIEDIRVVMDAASSFKAFVFGTSEGAVRAAVFAATHPERVAGLVLYAGYAKATFSEDYQHAPEQLMEMLLASVEANWGHQFASSLFAPSASPEQLEYLARVQRSAMGPGDALAMVRFTYQLDIRAVLPAIGAPTLLLHRTGDRLVPVAQSRYLAEQITDARLVELPGDDNAVGVGDAESVLREIEQFVTGTAPAPPSNRALTTVLFTDIVGSTELASTQGDAQWRSLKLEHDRLMDAVAGDFGGRLVKTTGDGVLATFDGPARAVRCALAMGIAARSLDLEICAGLHTGEVEFLEHDVTGVGVNIAARVQALSQPGRVLVTSTVKELVVGSGIEFEDGGVHTLKGVADDWHLYLVDRA